MSVVKAALWAVVWLLLTAGAGAAAGNPIAWMGIDRSMLEVALELASGVPKPSAERDSAADWLYWQLVVVNTEQIFADELLSVRPDQTFASLVPAEGTQPVDYLYAAHRSFGRLKAAELVGERDWMSKQLTASAKYAALAAEGLRREAAEGDEKAARLQSERFAVRRPAGEAQAVLEALRSNGLRDDQRKSMTDRGLAQEDIDAYQKRLQAMPAAELGISMVELHQRIADTRRRLAASLDKFAPYGASATESLGESFVVGNPRDREVVVHLVVRRVAMPPEWTLSLKEVASGAQGPLGLKETEQGRRYEVRLPPGGQIRVISEVVPGGPVAQNTTARWAIEGRIGEELLGGVVQEVNVPGFLPDLQLPPIATAAQVPLTAKPRPSLVTPSATGTSSRNTVWVFAAITVAVIAVAVVLVRRRRRT